MTLKKLRIIPFLLFSSASVTGAAPIASPVIVRCCIHAGALPLYQAAVVVGGAFGGVYGGVGAAALYNNPEAADSICYYLCCCKAERKKAEKRGNQQMRFI